MVLTLIELLQVHKHKTAFEGAWYVNYSFGPVSIGYTESYMDSGANGTAEAVLLMQKMLQQVTQEQLMVSLKVNKCRSLST